MSDIINLLGVAVMIVFVVFTYVFLVQLVNEPTCLSLAKSSTLGRELMQLISLCWW